MPDITRFMTHPIDRHHTIPALMLLILLAILVVCAALGLVWGSSGIDWSGINSLLRQEKTDTQAVIVQLRLSRIFTAFVCGGSLALAGLLMQVLLRNPLADPYILGVSGGAASFYLLFLLLGLPYYWLNAGAWLGALLSVFLVFIFAYRAGLWQMNTLLLTGVILASGWSAVISLLLVIAPAENVHGMLFWLMGEIQYMQANGFAAAVLVFAAILSLSLAPQLNILLWGEIHAASLGVRVQRLKIVIFLLASLLTASVVVIAGSIGFIGLIVPHLMRLAMGYDHRFLIPAVILAGGSLLIIADTLSRIVMAPEQLPVGVLTAIMGVPLFLYLLCRNKS